MKSLDNTYSMAQSNVQLGFTVDTLTKGGKVVVEQFQLNPLR
ncbi:MAG: hypothetical protein O7G88_15695 [bacterium]|nr:hypothetical protein [bacterium]